ncbi:MAG: diphosphate--fructose-6-phosphate 1-phosphotransferase, partial [Candidatus Margulisiibacteriota bacterium]
MSLEKKLIDRECQKSALECELRSRKVDVCESFLVRDGIAPMQFESDSRITIPVLVNTDVAKTFPKTAKDHASGVLSASPRRNDTRGKRVAVLFSGGPAAGGHN